MGREALLRKLTFALRSEELRIQAGGGGGSAAFSVQEMMPVGNWQGEEEEGRSQTLKVLVGFSGLGACITCL